MKFACLGYGAEGDWERRSAAERDALIKESFAYDEVLVRDGLFLQTSAALQGAQTAKILRWVAGKVVVTDGPFAETKEQLGGLGVMETDDIEQAIEILSQHPGLRLGATFEIRPLDEETLERFGVADHYRNSPSPRPGVRFASLGYVSNEALSSMSNDEGQAMMKKCIAFDRQRMEAGEWLAGIKLQGVGQAKSLRLKQGRVIVTDGPFAETKEQLGGIVLLQLRGIEEAVELLSQHPALPYGICIELRPTNAEIDAQWEATCKRALASGKV